MSVPLGATVEVLGDTCREGGEPPVAENCCVPVGTTVAVFGVTNN